SVDSCWFATLLLYYVSSYLTRNGNPRHIHSFPTRRSSDLWTTGARAAGRERRRRRDDEDLPERLPVGLGHRGLPDRGGRGRGRPDAVDLGNLLPHAGAHAQRLHRRRGHRPPPPLEYLP